MKEQPRFEDYWPVDVARLRPGNAYAKMKAVRKERMQAFLDSEGNLNADMFDERDCPVCGSSDQEFQFEKEGFRFVTCRECELLFVNPCLKEDCVRDVYEHESYSQIIRALMDDSNKYRRERFGRERVEIIESWMGSSSGEERRLLEIGCATGFFLEEARARGWDACGVEANPYAAKYAREQGLDVRDEMVEQTTFPDGSFDAVAAFEVIEHVHDPMAVLRNTHRLLRPGGMLFLYTPNYNCAERLILGDKSHFIWGSNHLTYFTPRTLSTAVEHAGFEVVHWETQGLDVEDIIWHYEATGGQDVSFLAEFRHELQFLMNSSTWGKNLRLYARRADAAAE